MLTTHLNLLLWEDNFFKSHWEQLTILHREQLMELATTIDTMGGTDLIRLHASHAHECDKMRRYLSCIPQRELDYSRRPRDWAEFVTDDVAKEQVYELALAILTSFLDGRRPSGGARLYGGIKPVASLDAKFGEQKIGSPARRSLRDTWDAVRFRIIARDVNFLREIAIEVWQCFCDEIVKCRNYYFDPKGPSDDPYRSVHFELEIAPQRWIELQLLTEARDLVGFFDYPFLFKKVVPFVSDDHRRWLQSFSLKANVFDGSNLNTNALRVL